MKSTVLWRKRGLALAFRCFLAVILCGNAAADESVRETVRVTEHSRTAYSIGLTGFETQRQESTEREVIRPEDRLPEGLPSFALPAENWPAENWPAENLTPPSFNTDSLNTENLNTQQLSVADAIVEEPYAPMLGSSAEPQYREINVLTPDEALLAPLNEFSPEKWSGYNPTQSDMTWLPAGNDLGLFSIQGYPSLSNRSVSGLNAGYGFHFLNGPSTTDLPPRLFDFDLAYQNRKIQTDHWMLDIRLGVGVFSDFEGSARKGVRFPGHIVSFYEINRQLTTVFGAEVFDRDDISVLPVTGFIWRPNERLSMELVFPRPKVQWQFHSNYALYFSGELGGGTWAIERDDRSNDNVTYRDLRFAFGLTELHPSRGTVLEFGFATDRSLEFRSGNGNQSLDSSLMLRLRHHF